jgi:hypothetical protein
MQPSWPAEMTEAEREAWGALTLAAVEIVAPALPLYAAAWVELNAPGLPVDEAKAAYRAAMPSHLIALEAMMNAARLALLDAVETRNATLKPH